MSDAPVAALVADDEPLLREELSQMLREAWPGLRVVHARNGREAVETFEAEKPAICFLDVHMPGMSGVEAARHIGDGAHIVFVTAFEQYAVQAFEQGAIDYIVKPVDASRLATTVARLQARLRASAPSLLNEELLRHLALQLKAGSREPGRLRWLRATGGGKLRMIHVDSVDFLRSDEKYTLIGWRGEDGKPAEALIATSLRELLPQLDPQQFAQVHRSCVVNLHAVAHVVPGENETAKVHLKGRGEVLPVSRSFRHVFRQM